MLDTFIDGSVLPSVFHLLINNGEAQSLGEPFLKEIRGGVGGAIVDDKPFKVAISLTLERLKEPRQRVRPVVGRRKDGERWHYFCLNALR